MIRVCRKIRRYCPPRLMMARTNLWPIAIAIGVHNILSISPETPWSILSDNGSNHSMSVHLFSDRGSIPSHGSLHHRIRPCSLFNPTPCTWTCVFFVLTLFIASVIFIRRNHAKFFIICCSTKDAVIWTACTHGSRWATNGTLIVSTIIWVTLDLKFVRYCTFLGV